MRQFSRIGFPMEGARGAEIWSKKGHIGKEVFDGFPRFQTNKFQKHNTL